MLVVAKKGLGLGEKLAEVCDGEVLQGAAEAVEFDRKGLRENSALITHECIGRSFRFERQHLDRFLRLKIPTLLRGDP